GGPGVPGARWAPENITFPSVDGDKAAQLASSTDGTASGTKHTELLQNQMRFFEGTYAARIKFADAPVSGADGDRVNQTFFTISPLRYDNDPLYS
ncbi:hydrolase, partial [Bacillus paralicheniformis]|nr:hydrolase [Bacillus paralicheniformis]